MPIEKHQPRFLAVEAAITQPLDQQKEWLEQDRDQKLKVEKRPVLIKKPVNPEITTALVQSTQSAQRLRYDRAIFALDRLQQTDSQDPLYSSLNKRYEQLRNEAVYLREFTSVQQETYQIVKQKAEIKRETDRIEAQKQAEPIELFIDDFSPNQADYGFIYQGQKLPFAPHHYNSLIDLVEATAPISLDQLKQSSFPTSEQLPQAVITEINQILEEKTGKKGLIQFDKDGNVILNKQRAIIDFLPEPKSEKTAPSIAIKPIPVEPQPKAAVIPETSAPDISSAVIPTVGLEQTKTPETAKPENVIDISGDNITINGRLWVATPTEQRVLRTLLDPEHSGKTPAEFAPEVGIYRRWLKETLQGISATLSRMSNGQIRIRYESGQPLKFMNLDRVVDQPEDEQLPTHEVKPKALPVVDGNTGHLLKVESQSPNALKSDSETDSVKDSLGNSEPAVFELTEKGSLKLNGVLLSLNLLEFKFVEALITSNEQSTLGRVAQQLNTGTAKVKRRIDDINSQLKLASLGHVEIGYIDNNIVILDNGNPVYIPDLTKPYHEAEKQAFTQQVAALIQLPDEQSHNETATVDLADSTKKELTTGETLPWTKQDFAAIGAILFNTLKNQPDSDLSQAEFRALSTNCRLLTTALSGRNMTEYEDYAKWRDISEEEYKNLRELTILDLMEKHQSKDAWNTNLIDEDQKQVVKWIFGLNPETFSQMMDKSSSLTDEQIKTEYDIYQHSWEEDTAVEVPLTPRVEALTSSQMKALQPAIEESFRLFKTKSFRSLRPYDIEASFKKIGQKTPPINMAKIRGNIQSGNITLVDGQVAPEDVVILTLLNTTVPGKQLRRNFQGENLHQALDQVRTVIRKLSGNVNL